MKVLLVNGSPHKEGCTYTALTEVDSALNENGIDTDVFWIGNKPLSGCIACKTCVKKHLCVFDDKVNEFLDLAGDYDGFIFGTPVHWGAATGAITSFLDRVFYADFCGGGNRFLLKPAGLAISARRAGTTAAWDQTNKYLGFLSRGTFQGMGKNRREKPRGRSKAAFGGRQYKTLTPPRTGAWSAPGSPYSCGFGGCAASLNVHARRGRSCPYSVLWERPGARGQSHRKTYRQPPHQCRRFCR